MLKRIRDSITTPQTTFTYIKDSFKRVFVYILLMALIMSLPVILAGFFTKESFFPSDTSINGGFNNYIISDDLSIENGKLVNEKNLVNAFNYQEYYYAIKQIPQVSNGYVILFEEEGISVYAVLNSITKVKIDYQTYNDLEISNLEFKSQNSIIFARAINGMLVENNIMITGKIIFAIFTNLVDYVMLALLLAAFSSFTRNLNLKFSDHFKINSYTLTIYALITLIMHLFQVSILYYVALIMGFMFQSRAYRSIFMIRQIESRKKDDDIE